MHMTIPVSVPIPASRMAAVSAVFCQPVRPQPDADLWRAQRLPDFTDGGLQNGFDAGLRGEFGGDGVHDAFALSGALAFLEQTGIIERDRQAIGQLTRQFKLVRTEAC